MRVVKRNGDFEDVSFDKVLNRIKILSKDIDVNVFEIAQKVCSRIYDGVKTTELDELAAHMCSSMIVDNPDYGKLASRIIVSNHHKNTSPSFSETIQILYDNKDVDGRHCPLISAELYDNVMKNKEKLNSVIDYSRDYDFDYFGFKTLERSYLMKVNGRIIERPQHMWMRVALGIHGADFKDALQTYDMMSRKFFTHATPTLFNAGTPRPQNSSCFLLSMNEDSISGIYDSLKEVAMISKYAGGIGIHMHQIRAKGSRIRGTNGISTGLVPMLRVFNNTARYVDQAGKRLGSIAVYLEPWHADLDGFLELRKNHGNEEDRCRDLFLALWVPDLFMERVKNNGKWSMMCPDMCKGLSDVWGDEFKELYEKYESEGKFIKQVDAQTLWFKIMEAQIEQGVPYILFKDACNKKSNQQNLGTIKSSNLCVAGDTMILTKDGYFPIEALKNKEVDVWNGKEWSTTTVRQTGENQKLMNISFSNGMSISCTPYHKFYVETGTRPSDKSIPKIVEAKDLQPDMKIIRYNTALVPSNDIELKYAYTQGLYAAEGCCFETEKEKQQCHYSTWNETMFCKRHQDYVASYPNSDNKCCAESNSNCEILYLYGEKKQLIEYVDKRYVNDNTNRYNVALPKDMMDKYFVPLNMSTNAKLRWLEGYLDGDGSVVKYEEIKNIQVASTNRDFLTRVFFLLQTLGIMPSLNKVQDEREAKLPDGKGGSKMYQCSELYRINIDCKGLLQLVKLGFSPKRLQIDNMREPHHVTNRYVKVKMVEDNNVYGDTYCFNEPKEHKGIFNGVLTGNCTEIVEYSSPDEIAVCNLASICLPSYVEQNEKGEKYFNYEKLHEISKIVTKNLNKVIDCNFYPLEKARKSNLRHRPIGMGIQGLADVFVMLRLPFESEKAKQINKDIFETIYHAALETSMEISKKRHLLIMEAREKGDDITMNPYNEYLKLNEFEIDVVKTSHPGTYVTFEGSPASKGLLQFDLWEKTPSDRYDWNQLKEDIKTYGIRNSLLLAPMPTASTAQIMGFNESFEPFTSNIFKRKVLSGEFVLVNKYLISDLINLGIWNKDMKDQIILNEGSIQAIDGIPQEMKDIYKTVWEIRQKNLVDMSADRGIYICQSQSLNIFMEDRISVS